MLSDDKRKKLLYVAARIAAILCFGIILLYPGLALLGALFSYTSGGIIAHYPAELQTEFARRHETYVPYRSIPQCAIDGIISVEDKRFFSHPGIDPIAIVRVLLLSIQNYHQDQGGSTITQQLSRLILHEPRQQPSVASEIYSQLRILKYTLILEHDFSKDTILELYLNSVYYGRSAQGLVQAAHAYFKTDLVHLTTGQCIYLTGLPQAPGYFGNHPDGVAAHTRYLHVLATMERNGYLTSAQEQMLGKSALFSSTTPIQ